jgi:hypothetical protein
MLTVRALRSFDRVVASGAYPGNNAARAAVKMHDSACLAHRRGPTSGVRAASTLREASTAGLRRPPTKHEASISCLLVGRSRDNPRRGPERSANSAKLPAVVTLWITNLLEVPTLGPSEMANSAERPDGSPLGSLAPHEGPASRSLGSATTQQWPTSFTHPVSSARTSAATGDG